MTAGQGTAAAATLTLTASGAQSEMSDGPGRKQETHMKKSSAAVSLVAAGMLAGCTQSPAETPTDAPAPDRAPVEAAACATLPMIDADYQGAFLHHQGKMELGTPDGRSESRPLVEALTPQYGPNAYMFTKFAPDEVQLFITSNCPQHQSILDTVLAVDAQWDGGLRADGDSRVVGDGADQMRPGIWQTNAGGMIEDCYWERSSAAGEIIDNNFVTAAAQITVTLQDGEIFSAERCGDWKHVE